MNQLEEKRAKDLWQISILLDVENNSTLLLTVTKDCHTGELFQKLRLHPKTLSNADFQLFSIGGSIRSSLDENENECLSDYDITDRSTLVLMARLPGGVWPTAKEVEAEPRHLKPADGITLTTISDEHPDVFCLEYDCPGVIMPCGHATAPMPLALYCRGELEKGKDEIRCPKCNDKWKFALLKPAACLTQNEITEFERRAHINYFRKHPFEMNPCPKCGTFSRLSRAEDKRVVCRNCTHSLGKQFQFCWTCLGEWKTSGNETCGNPNCGSNKALLEILANCETKKLKGMRIEIPSKRACPNCSIVIDHKKGCKHMTCITCRYEFCFICLKKFPCGTGWSQPCDVAPRQTFDTNFTGVSDNIKKQLNSEEPVIDLDLETEEQTMYYCNLFREVEDEETEQLMDEMDDHYRNAFSSDGITANSYVDEIVDDNIDESEALVHMPAVNLVSKQRCIGSSFNIERDFHSEWSGDSSNEDPGAGVPGTEPNDSDVILGSSRNTEPTPPPKLEEITSETTATCTSGLDGNDSDVVLEPIRKRGPPRPPKPQQRKDQASATDMICRPNQNDSDVILEPSREKGPPPPPKPQLSVQALAKRFETILGTLF